MPNTVVLGEVWANKGYAGMTLKQRYPLWDALHIKAPEPSDAKPDIDTLYRGRMDAWAKGGAVYQPELIADLKALEVIPVHHLLTVSDVLYNKMTLGDVRLASKTSVWRWTKHPFAFTVFWALSFHLSTTDFEHPEGTFNQLLYMAGECHPQLSRASKHWRALMLSLYERAVGMEYDMKTNQPHYTKNIVDRKSSRPMVAASHRQDAFAKYVEHCKERIERELKHVQ